MNNKIKIPTWVYILIGIIAIFIYQKYQSQPVSSLIGTTMENHSVYAGPNVNTYDEIGSLDANTDIILTGRSGSTWVTFNYNGQQGWIQEFFLDIVGNVLRLPEIENTSSSNKSISREVRVMSYLQSIVSDDRYDSSIMVMHKYINQLDIELSNNELTFTLTKDTDTYEDFISLAIDLIFGTIMISDAGGESDWNLTRIELISPGPANSYASIFIKGHKAIEFIAQDSSKIYDLMQTDVSYGDYADTSKPNVDSSYVWENDEPSNNNGVLGCPNGCTYHKEGCDIKGNVSFDSGEKIYHLPNQEFYSNTVINTKYGERWFCTEAEAIANGWRKSKE